jgi:hypothetical protein
MVKKGNYLGLLSFYIASTCNLSSRDLEIMDCILGNTLNEEYVKSETYSILEEIGRNIHSDGKIDNWERIKNKYIPLTEDIQWGCPGLNSRVVSDLCICSILLCNGMGSPTKKDGGFNHPWKK